MDDKIEKFYASRDPLRQAQPPAGSVGLSTSAILAASDCRPAPQAIAGPSRPPAGEPASLLFDPDYYRSVYPDVARSGHDPVSHYRQHGAAEGRRPNPYFDTAWYVISSGAEVGVSGMNPFLHYVLYGYREGFPPRAPGTAPDRRPAR